MGSDFDPILEAAKGVASRQQLLAFAPRGGVDREIRSGRLVRIAPQAYARPWEADQRSYVEAAALKNTGPACALSHTTALRRWGLLAGNDELIHITAATDERPRPRNGVRVHRTRLPIEAVAVGGAATVLPAWAIVGSWPLATTDRQRAPVIAAVRNRIVTVDEVRSVVRDQTRVRGRAALIRLLDLIADGCQSELELWGYLSVFDIPGLHGAIRQRTVVVDRRVYRLDMAYEREKVAVELDGRAYHAAPDQWERDIARDLALARLGWLTVRLSHRRLTSDVAGCQRDVLQVLASRQR